MVQPVRGPFTPKRTNVEMLLEAATPGGTLVQETFKRAASTPDGEDADARAKRLAAERARLYRARARLEAKLNPRPLLTEQESDTALSVASLTAALDHAGFELQPGDIAAFLPPFYLDSTSLLVHKPLSHPLSNQSQYVKIIYSLSTVYLRFIYTLSTRYLHVIYTLSTAYLH